MKPKNGHTDDLWGLAVMNPADGHSDEEYIVWFYRILHDGLYGQFTSEKQKGVEGNLKDRLLKLVHEMAQNVEQEDLKASFFSRKEISINKGCLVLGLQALKC